MIRKEYIDDLRETISSCILNEPNHERSPLHFRGIKYMICCRSSKSMTTNALLLIL